MSRGALKELANASIEKFIRMIKNVPNSEKGAVRKYFTGHITVLGDN